MTANYILALDVGERRVGLAVASTIARLPQPFKTLQRDESFWDNLKQVIAAEQIDSLIIGLPRGLDGQETGQTATVRAFAQELTSLIDLPQTFQDEALTSQKAEAELVARSKPYQKGDIDMLAATYILQDYLEGAN